MVKENVKNVRSQRKQRLVKNLKAKNLVLLEVKNLDAVLSLINSPSMSIDPRACSKC